MADSSTRLFGIKADEVDAVWSSVSDLIAKALERGGNRFTLSDIYKALLDRDMQLWVASNGAVKGLCITEIRDYPNRKVCAALICTGEDARVWAHHVDGIMEWAKSKGCRTFEAWSRKGWERVFKGKLKMTHVLLERDL